MMTVVLVAATHPLQIALAGLALYQVLAPVIRALRAGTNRKSVRITPQTRLPLAV